MSGNVTGLPSMNGIQAGAGVGGAAGAAAPGGAPGAEQPKEVKKAFDQVWNEIQSKYGGKEEKPREIKKSLGKDDFLKIMLTQLKHQDPTKPMEAEKMAAEMAQLTSVEQLQNVNKTLESLAAKNNANDRLTMAGLIGKSVTIDRNRFPHVENDRETLAFTLPADAATVKATILSETGETIFEKDLGPQKAGENNFLWDGKKMNTLASKGGNYVLRIDARGTNQQPLNPTTQVRTQVVGVNYEGGDAVLLVGNLARPEKISMKNVIKIDAGTQPAAAKAPGAPATEAEPAGGGSFFSFTPGVGSKPLDMAALAPQAQAAIAKLSKAEAPPSKAAAQAAMEQDAKDKGFPSGLSESSESGAKEEVSRK